jgi:hypothetical protein
MKLVACTGCLFVFIAAAQTASRPRADSPARAIVNQPAVRPVAGLSDISKVLNALVASGGLKHKKEEFETTAAFESRMKAIADQQGRLEFLLPQSSTAFEYSADSEEMLVKIVTWHRFVETAEEQDLGSLDALVLKTIHKAPSELQYAVAFHKSTRLLRLLEEQQEDDLLLEVLQNRLAKLRQGVRQIRDYELTKHYIFRIPAKPDEARAMKPSLRVLISGRLAGGRVYKGHENLKAGRDTLYAPLVVESIKVIDARTGSEVGRLEDLKEESATTK